MSDRERSTRTSETGNRHSCQCECGLRHGLHSFTTVPNHAPWYSSETLALYKSLTYLLTIPPIPCRTLKWAEE